MESSGKRKLLDSCVHVIWDWNGTLLDDAWLCIEAMNLSLAKRALPLLTPDRYQDVFDFPVINYYRKLGFDFERESFETAGAEFMAEYERRRGEARLREGAVSVLQHLRALGKSQSVLSAYPHHTLEQMLRAHRIRDYFDHVIGADNIYAHGKVEQGRMLMRTLGLRPEEVALIGDTTHDFEVGQAMGCRCFLIPAGNHSRRRLEACGVTIIETLSELAG